MLCLCGRLQLVVAVLLALLSLLKNVESATNTSFTGKQYIEYKIANRPAESHKDKVTLRFKTWQAYGVLMYSCGLQGDFLLLEIKRGKLV